MQLLVAEAIPIGEPETVIATEELRLIVDCILLTERLPSVTPVSASLICGSDGGKTRLILEHIPPTSRILNDFHYATLIPMLADSKDIPKRVIVPDFNMVLSHRPTVATLTCALLLGLMGEGIDELPGLEKEQHKLKVKELKDRGINLAVLTAMTPDMFKAKRGKWRQTGFLRRLMPLFYKYKSTTVEKIQSHISSGEFKASYPKNAYNPHTGPEPQIDARHLRIIEQKARESLERLVWFWKDEAKGTNVPIKAIDYPFTLQKNFIALAKAHAMYCNRKAVTDEDAGESNSFLDKVAEYVRYDHPKEI